MYTCLKFIFRTYAKNLNVIHTTIVHDFFLNVLIFKCYFLGKDRSSEQTPFSRVFTYGTHFTAETTEAMRIKCLAQEHNILMLLGFEPSTSLSISRHLSHMTKCTIKCTMKFARLAVKKSFIILDINVIIFNY